MRISKELEEKVINEYLSYKDRYQILSDNNISNTSLFRILKKNNIKNRGSTKYKKQDEEKIIKRYLSGEPTTSICKDYNTSHSSIIKILKRNKIKRRNDYEKKERLKCNRNFFSKIDSEEKAYWLGFIAADGHVKEHYVKIYLSIKDKDHLVTFKKTINSDHKLQIIKRPYKDQYLYRIALDIPSKEMAYDLFKLGYGGNKTNYLMFPDFLPDNLMNHFLRGLIDGDGCWTGHKFTFCSPKNFAEKAQAYLMNKCNLPNKTKLQIESKNCNVVSVIYTGRKQLLRIYNFLYKNATVFLERKKTMAEKIIGIHSNYET